MTSIVLQQLHPYISSDCYRKCCLVSQTFLSTLIKYPVFRPRPLLLEHSLPVHNPTPHLPSSSVLNLHDIRTVTTSPPLPFNPREIRVLFLRHCRSGSLMSLFESSPLLYLDVSFSFNPNPSLACLSHLRFLSLRGLVLSPEYCRQLSAAIPTLRGLDISFCNLAEPITITCFISKHLKYLNLFKIICTRELLDLASKTIVNALISSNCTAIICPSLGLLSHHVSQSTIPFKWTNMDDFPFNLNCFNNIILTLLCSNINRHFIYPYSSYFDLVYCRFGPTLPRFDSDRYSNCHDVFLKRSLVVDPLFIDDVSDDDVLNLLCRSCNSHNISQVLPKFQRNSDSLSFILSNLNSDLITPANLMPFLKELFEQDDDVAFSIIFHIASLFESESALLFLAVQSNAVKITRFLIGAGLEGRPKLLTTLNASLVSSIKNHSYDVTAAIISAGAILSDESEFLELMGDSTCFPLLSLLIEENAIESKLIDVKDSYGRTLFLNSILEGNVSLMSFLFKNHCRVQIKDVEGFNAFDLAWKFFQKFQNSQSFQNVLEGLFLIIPKLISESMYTQKINSYVLNSLDDDLCCLCFKTQLPGFVRDQLTELIETVTDLGCLPLFVSCCLREWMNCRVNLIFLVI
ncbi:hypothetical protein GEMRC1_004361 [Eukaryota sp. GEM-RC1]